MALSLFFGVKCTMYTEIIHVFVLYCIYNKLYMYVLALIVNYRIYNYEHDNIIMYVQIALMCIIMCIKIIKLLSHKFHAHEIHIL